MCSLISSRIFYVFRSKRFTFYPNIKAVRSIVKTYCNNVTSAELVNSVSEDFNTMKMMWLQNDLCEVKTFLFKKFSAATNCYSYTLQLVDQAATCKLNFAEDWQRTRFSGLSFDIIQAFSNWLENNNATEPLTLQLKQEAIEVLIKHQNNLVQQLIGDTFKIQDDKHKFIMFIEGLLADNKIEEACQYITVLELQNEFPIDQFIPLLLRRKVSSVIKYLAGYTELQIEVVKKLDEMIGQFKTGNLSHKLTVKEIAHQRSIYKSLTSITSTFNISTEHWPNLQKMQKKGALNVLLKRRLDDRTDLVSWENELLSTVKNEPDLLISLLYKLVAINDFEIALRIAEKFDIHEEKWPPTLKQMKLNPENKIEIENHENNEDSSETVGNIDYLPFTLSLCDVKFVATETEFLECLNHIVQNHNIVGFDSEWKPKAERHSQRLSLLQLAVTDKVYILDMIALGECLEENHWNSLVIDLFRNPSIVKLGCSLIQDVQMLVDDFKGTSGKQIKFSHMLDICILYDKVQRFYVSAEKRIGCYELPGTKGLSRICEITLGKPICKGERFCDWEIRPLTEAQMIYAALDAHSLILIFNAIKQELNLGNENFERFVSNAIFWTTSSAKHFRGKHKYNLTRDDKSFTLIPTVYVKNFNVLVDSTLIELGLKIRMYGASVLILEKSIPVEKIAQMIEEQNAVYIGPQKIITKDSAVLPERKCFTVDEKNKLESNVALIFQHFNVRMMTTDIYSRCMVCNGNEFISIFSEDLKVIWSQLRESKDENSQNLEIHCDDGNFISNTGLINNKVEVQLQNLSPNVFSENEKFHICKSCGNIPLER